MSHSVLIEDIAGRRRRAGVDDADLRDAICRLAVGDLVRITLRADQSPSGETVLVRITEVSKARFEGELAGRPTSKGLSDLAAGFAFGFTADHIHSLPDGRPAQAPRRPRKLTGTPTSFRSQEEHHG
jgi:hypothetical protein